MTKKPRLSVTSFSMDRIPISFQFRKLRSPLATVTGIFQVRFVALTPVSFKHKPLIHINFRERKSVLPYGRCMASNSSSSPYSLPCVSYPKTNLRFIDLTLHNLWKITKLTSTLGACRTSLVLQIVIYLNDKWLWSHLSKWQMIINALTRVSVYFKKLSQHNRQHYSTNHRQLLLVTFMQFYSLI